MAVRGHKEHTHTQVILINWILTKLPVADCHPRCKCYQFCLGLQLQRAVSFSVGWCSPGLNVWTPSEVEYLWIPWYSCMLAGWIDAESQRIDREMEVGTDGWTDRWWGVGLLFPQPVACGYCAITVGLVWVLYYCTIWRIVIYCVRKEHSYPSLILYQVLKNLKAFQPAYWTVFKGPMACHFFFRLNCLCILFICVDFLSCQEVLH